MTKLATSTLLALTLASVAGCDKKAAESAQAETKTTEKKGEAEAESAPDAKAPETKADVKAPEAKATAIAEADYAKGIVGTWKQVSQTIVAGDEPPFEVPTPPDLEMFLEFEADGGYVNRGIVQGKEHKTESTYKVEGATFRVGSNEPVKIESMTSTSMKTVVESDAGLGSTVYERVGG